MPLFMDRHYVEGATKSAVAHAHELDLAIQEKYKVQFLTYWFDEPRCTAFCLINSPDKETLQKAHGEAHGLIPHEIIEVNPAVVEAFLGRVKDPTPVDSHSHDDTGVDSAFRAIMFTDLKDSTLMTTTFGDAKALHLLRIHNALIRNALRDTNGREVKHTGDGIMASFASVPDAVDCAVAIQKGFAEHNAGNSDAALYVRIGVSAGEPIEEDGDLFGSAVQLAARLCAAAQPGEVLVAEAVKDRCAGDDRFIDHAPIMPKGFDRQVNVFGVKL